MGLFNKITKDDLQITNLQKNDDDSYEELIDSKENVIWNKYEEEYSSKSLNLMVDPSLGFQINQSTTTRAEVNIYCHAIIEERCQLLICREMDDGSYTYQKGKVWSRTDGFSNLRPIRKGCALTISTISKHSEHSKPYATFTEGISGGCNTLSLNVEVSFPKDLVDRLIQSINRDPDIVITITTRPKLLTNNKEEILLNLTDYTYTSKYAEINFESNINRPLGYIDKRTRLNWSRDWTDGLTSFLTKLNHSNWLLLLWIYLIVSYVVNSS